MAKFRVLIILNVTVVGTFHIPWDRYVCNICPYVSVLIIIWNIFFFFSSILADESNERYQALLAHIADLLTKLNTALATAQGLQGSLDALLRWLDQAERDVTKMDRGTIIIAKKEPLLKNIEEQMVCSDSFSFIQYSVKPAYKGHPR